MYSIRLISLSANLDIIDLIGKDGEQYYFYNDNKLERIS